MFAKMSKQLAEAIGVKNLREIGIEKDTFTYDVVKELDLRDYTSRNLMVLHRMVESHRSVLGAKSLLKDLETWQRAADTPGQIKARSVQQMVDLVIETMKKVIGKRLFRKDATDPDAWLCHYVNEVEFLPAEKHSGGGYTPPRCRIELIWEEFGGRKNTFETYGPAEIIGKSAEQMLANDGLFLETEEMRERYLREVDRWRKLAPQIGIQFWAKGIGSTALDGNEREDRGKKIFLSREGQPSRVVIDLFRETDEKEYNSRDVHVDPHFWRQQRRVRKKLSEEEKDNYRRKRNEKEEFELQDEDAEAEGLTMAEDDDENPERVVEIPVHPKLACFHMTKHLRMQIHVNNLTEYIYDRELASKLVLPAESRGLVEILLAKQEEFKDIVAGKSGGTIILCAGPPGTGKTLTAEVYAEAVARPLYSVQASQLGVQAEQLEKELMLVLQRGRRWNAVMLLDEADVYVHARGDDLYQNAIVGVFLRVLEYHASVLFLTTNRAETVDDAIASRCTAKIVYSLPTPENQAKIWRILADNAEIDIADKEIAKIVKEHALSGRDVKNLLKLAALFSKASGKPVTAETIAYVKNFKPTAE